MYPKSKFRKSYLRKMGVPEDELDTYIDSVNDISNLQLLAAQMCIRDRENAAHLGLPVPEKMKDILAQLHDRAENTESEGK